MEQTPPDTVIDSSRVTNLASTVTAKKNDHLELEAQMLASKAPDESSNSTETLSLDALSTSERALMLYNAVRSEQTCTDNTTTGALSTSIQVPENDLSPPPSVQVLEERSNPSEDAAPDATPSAPVDIEAPPSVLVIDEVRSDHQCAGDDKLGI